eukprot:356802-Chlamydomonas_euryale.AAC.6
MEHHVSSPKLSVTNSSRHVLMTPARPRRSGMDAEEGRGGREAGRATDCCFEVAGQGGLLQRRGSEIHDPCASTRARQQRLRHSKSVQPTDRSAPAARCALAVRCAARRAARRRCMSPQGRRN